MAKNLNIPLVKDGGRNKGKKWVRTAALLLILFLLIGWGLYEKFWTLSEPSTKAVTAEKKSTVVGCIKPQLTLYTPVEPPKPKKNSGSHHKAPPVQTPEKAVVAQGPKEGTECVAFGHHGVVKIIDGKVHCEWEERAKEQPVPPAPTPVKIATAPTAPAVPVLSPPIESKSLLDDVDPDYGKTKVEFTPLPEKEAPPRRRRVVVVMDQPQYYGGWYGASQVPSPYYYTSTPVYTPTVVAAPSVVTPAPSVVRPPAVITMPATAGTIAGGRAPAVITR